MGKSARAVDIDRLQPARRVVIDNKRLLFLLDSTADDQVSNGAIKNRITARFPNDLTEIVARSRFSFGQHDIKENKSTMEELDDPENGQNSCFVKFR